jgi:alcohol dehydrogenase class IV
MAYGEQSLKLCREIYLGEQAGQSAENDDKLMVASLMGGLSLTYSEVGVCHALSYGLSKIFGEKHCYANCLAFQHLSDFYPEGVEEFESGASNQSDVDKFINNTGLDYMSDIQKAKQLVKISASPLLISELPQAYGKCAIELGINKELLGIDKGKYDGTSVLAFYYGESRSTASIWIVEKPCIKLENL